MQIFASEREGETGSERGRGRGRGRGVEEEKGEGHGEGERGRWKGDCLLMKNLALYMKTLRRPYTFAYNAYAIIRH